MLTFFLPVESPDADTQYLRAHAEHVVFAVVKSKRNWCYHGNDQMAEIQSRLPLEFKGSFQTLMDNMTEEVERDYCFSLKKSIGKRKCFTSLSSLSKKITKI